MKMIMSIDTKILSKLGEKVITIYDYEIRKPKLGDYNVCKDGIIKSSGFKDLDFAVIEARKLFKQKEKQNG